MSESDQPAANSQRAKNPSRRNLLFGGGAAGAAAAAWFGWPAIQSIIPRNFAFEPIDTIPGFRRFAGGQVSSSLNPLVAINSKSPYENSQATMSVRQNLCASLFGSTPVPPGVVPIASFSDYNCPYCRILSDILTDFDNEWPGKVQITWHEWPTLGLSSRVMARAALAARRQGAYLRFHQSLMRAQFLPGDSYLHALSEREGIDPELLRIDMKSQEIAWELTRSTSLARIFGFRGTPALVVGRTAVSGAISEQALKALIRKERKAGPVPGCA